MRKRFRPTPEADALVVLEIAREIENIDRISAPNAAERAERQRHDHEAERRRRERDRVAAEEWARKNQERRRAEQEREAQEQRAARAAAAEQARAEMAAQQQRNQEAAERRRLFQLEREWGMFKAQAAQAKFIQQRDEYFAGMQQSLENLSRMISPPPNPEPLPDYAPPDEKSARMGDPNWDPSEMGKAAIRWR
jgi:hypothetical protein